jgi:hypothetical protein
MRRVVSDTCSSRDRLLNFEALASVFRILARNELSTAGARAYPEKASRLISAHAHSPSNVFTYSVAVGSVAAPASLL